MADWPSAKLKSLPSFVTSKEVALRFVRHFLTDFVRKKVESFIPKEKASVRTRVVDNTSVGKYNNNNATAYALGFSGSLLQTNVSPMVGVQKFADVLSRVYNENARVVLIDGWGITL